MSADRIVFIPVSGPIQVFDESNVNRALRKMNDLLHDVITDHFWGMYEGERGMFFVDDTGMLDGLPVNSRATEAYLKCCRPGTVFSIHGDAVGLFGVLAQ